MHNAEYIINKCSISSVSTLGFQHGLHLSQYAFVEWFKVWGCDLIPHLMINLSQPHSWSRMLFTLKLFHLWPQQLYQAIPWPTWKQCNIVFGVPTWKPWWKYCFQFWTENGTKLNAIFLPFLNWTYHLLLHIISKRLDLQKCDWSHWLTNSM